MHLRTVNTKSTTETEAPASGKGAWIPKLLVLLVVLSLAALILTKFSDALTLERLASNETSLRQYQHEHPVLVYGVAFVTYVTFAALALPGAVVLTMLLGWFFGFWPGFFMALLAATCGATLSFLLSRYLLRAWIQQRFGPRLKTINASLEKEGAFYLFALRLIPVVPFFVINLAMGVTPMRLLTFCWVSLAGMLAGSAVYAYAGSAAPSLHTLVERGFSSILTPQILVAFVLLGLFPFLAKRALAAVQRRRLGQ